MRELKGHFVEIKILSNILFRVKIFFEKFWSFFWCKGSHKCRLLLHPLFFLSLFPSLERQFEFLKLWKEKYEIVLSANNGMTIMTVFKRVIHFGRTDQPTKRFSKVRTKSLAALQSH